VTLEELSKNDKRWRFFMAALKPGSPEFQAMESRAREEGEKQNDNPITSAQFEAFVDKAIEELNFK
jgi:hypothetical protein